MTRRHSRTVYRMIGIVGPSRIVSRLHAIAYRWTGGRWLLGHNLGLLNILLVTTGRKTGKVRETPLYGMEDGDRLIIIGTFGGREQEPAWVKNLRALPEAHIMVRSVRRPVLARELEGAERERAWRIAVDRYPGYDLYRTLAHRHIPVFALEPRGEEALA